MIITDLKLADATNGGPPGQLSDDVAAADKRIE